MAKPKYEMEIAGELFASKAAVIRRVRPLLERVGELAETDERFVRGLLARHRSAAEKIGPGILRIRVWKVQPFGTHGFYIDRVSGPGTDFSYLECLNPSTVMDKFTAACRTAVVSQVHAARDKAFAASATLSCPITGDLVTRLTSHVDHAKPWTFRAIVDEFILVQAIDVASVPLAGGGDGETQQSFANTSVANEFASFHGGRAILRVVSKAANLSVLTKKSNRQ